MEKKSYREVAKSTHNCVISIYAKYVASIMPWRFKFILIIVPDS